MMKRKKELLFAVFFGLAVAVIVYAASQTVLYWPFLNIQNKIDDSNFIRRFMLKGSDGTGTDNILIVDYKLVISAYVNLSTLARATAGSGCGLV